MLLLFIYIKMKNKLLIPIFIISIFLFQKIDYKIHDIQINQIFHNGIVNKTDYVGYIEIDRLKIKREIVIGINNLNLLNHVTMDKYDSFDDNHIVLAGHAIPNIFLNLNKIKISDEIKITSLNNSYFYEVISIDIVSKYNIDIIKTGDLVLITCKNKNERLVIKAKKINRVNS